jgi:hypothetical protein
MTERPNSKTPLDTNEWITVRTPYGAQITLYRNAQAYRVTAIDCYTRRLREPAMFVTEQPARDQARVWTLELLRNTTTFEVEILRNDTTHRYTVDLEAKPQ